jgi:hypothetical protein
VTGYYTNAGVPSSSYRTALPSQLNACDDIFVIPHADPHTWPTSERTALNNFILNQSGGMWAACHSPSSFRVVRRVDHRCEHELSQQHAA